MGDRVKEIAERLERTVSAIKHPVPAIMAACKQQPAEVIRAAYGAGIRFFGENRVQEAEAKWGSLKAELPGARLHLIGPLQTNKAKEAVVFFDCIETLDREKLADTLAGEMKRQQRSLPCLIQVNIGKEPQKAGVAPEELERFYAYCMGLELEIAGLMCVPPAGKPPSPYFALMQSYKEQLGLCTLSMGMSQDYETAARFGATEVRLGTVLFGKRV